jgi:DNA-binding response OmpR family regulator
MVASDSPGVATERILIVDDEPGIVDVLVYSLEEAGFATQVATDGATALRLALTDPPALVLLDIMLPGIDGLTVCREIRAVSDTPIILLTARGGEAERIAGLELEADDYVVKPFSVRELIARIRTVLRRAEGQSVREGGGTDNISLGMLRLDMAACEATWSATVVDLTRLQFDLLALLARHPRTVYTRAQLLEIVWGQSFTEDERTVDSMIKRLRGRLREAGAPAELIASRRDLGYCLDPAAATPSG